jgi:hypothetical protein
MVVPLFQGSPGSAPRRLASRTATGCHSADGVSVSFLTRAWIRGAFSLENPLILMAGAVFPMDRFLLGIIE